ncbi:MAG: hypothetical protein GF350_05240 [Chitinivibrionales bacterium]|nr:hypothetical protein [Chitinivibrionales bacterium]
MKDNFKSETNIKILLAQNKVFIPVQNNIIMNSEAAPHHEVAAEPNRREAGFPKQVRCRLYQILDAGEKQKHETYRLFGLMLPFHRLNKEIYFFA